MRYPYPVTTRSGNKVGWLYYTTEEEARTAAKVAIAEAIEKKEQGYDFGYLTPGTITKVTEGMYEGLWEVVVP